jgi:hypothetical protein
MVPGMSRSSTCAALALAASFTAPSAAYGADLFPAYFGRWVIAEAHPAPWVDPKDPSTAPFEDHITGKSVTFTPERIIAPRPLQCRSPNYKLNHVPPENLFQGGLTGAAAQAATLGFGEGTIPTLETGCNAAFEYHFTQAGTALFALNNTIYTLKRK